MRSRRRWVSSGLLVGAGLVAWNAGNWIFFILAGRLLGPSDYGLVAALLSACLVVAVLCSGLQPSLASANRGNPPDAIFARVVRVAIIVTAVGMIVVSATMLLAGVVYRGFPTGESLATISVVSGIAVFFLALGQLQTEGKFGRYSLACAVVGITRPIAFILLWLAGVSVISPLVGTATSWIVGAVVALWFARRALHTPPIRRTSEDWRRFTRALVPNAAGITALAILTNADVIAGRLVLGGRESGIFAATSAIGQGLFIVPQVFVILVLPRLAARHAQDKSSAMIATTGVTVTVAAGCGFALLALPLGAIMMQLTYGGAFRTSGELLPFYVFTMGFMGCIIVLQYHQVARRDFRYSWCLLGIAGLQVLLLAIFARSYETIIAVDLACAIAAIAAHELLAKRAGERIIDGFRRKSPA